ASGVVVWNAASGAACRGIDLIAESDGRTLRATTGRSGRVDLPAGHYSVALAEPGGSEITPAEIRVQPHDFAALYLRRHRMLEISVVDAEGAPISGARTTLRRSSEEALETLVEHDSSPGNYSLESSESSGVLSVLHRDFLPAEVRLAGGWPDEPIRIALRRSSLDDAELQFTSERTGSPESHAVIRCDGDRAVTSTDERGIATVPGWAKNKSLVLDSPGGWRLRFRIPNDRSNDGTYSIKTPDRSELTLLHADAIKKIRISPRDDGVNVERRPTSMKITPESGSSSTSIDCRFGNYSIIAEWTSGEWTTIEHLVDSPQSTAILRPSDGSASLLTLDPSSDASCFATSARVVRVGDSAVEYDFDERGKLSVPVDSWVKRIDLFVDETRFALVSRATRDAAVDLSGRLEYDAERLGEIRIRLESSTSEAALPKLSVRSTPDPRTVFASRITDRPVGTSGPWRLNSNVMRAASYSGDGDYALRLPTGMYDIRITPFQAGSDSSGAHSLYNVTLYGCSSDPSRDPSIVSATVPSPRLIQVSIDDPATLASMTGWSIGLNGYSTGRLTANAWRGWIPSDADYLDVNLHGVGSRSLFVGDPSVSSYEVAPDSSRRVKLTLTASPAHEDSVLECWLSKRNASLVGGREPVDYLEASIGSDSIAVVSLPDAGSVYLSAAIRLANGDVVDLYPQQVLVDSDQIQLTADRPR
ncbi:MAG: hypothetical protein AAF726_24985, partial [Planctomycetota bacterium]